MSKECKQCGTTFEQVSNRGNEQVYCSPKCRQVANYERLKKRLEPTAYENKGEKTGTPERTDNSHSRLAPGASGIGYALPMEPRGGEVIQAEPGRIDLFAAYVGSLQSTSEAKTDAIRHQLRADALEREVAALRQEVSELNAELSEYEAEEDPEPDGIGKVVSGLSEALPGLVRAYKEEPEATLNFVKKSLSGLFTA